jgi:hypothetical protein
MKYYLEVCRTWDSAMKMVFTLPKAYELYIETILTYSSYIAQTFLDFDEYSK